MNLLRSHCEILKLDESWLLNSLAALSFVVSEPQLDQLLRYMQLLQHWNKRINLTAITQSEDMWVKHILDSLVVLPYLTAANYVDVGTGAGLPGIPLAIMRPEWMWRLVDSNAKKIRFLQQVRLMLALQNVSVEHQRTEKIQRDSKALTVICRAYAEPLQVIAQVHSWLKVDEKVVLLQGQPQQPLPPQGYRSEHYTALHVPYLNASRHLWILVKQAEK